MSKLPRHSHLACGVCTLQTHFRLCIRRLSSSIPGDQAVYSTSRIPVSHSQPINRQYLVSNNVGVMRECTPYVRSHLVAETRVCERHMLLCTGNRPSSSSSPSSQSSASRRCFPYPRMDSSGRRPIGVDQGTQLLCASSLPAYGVLLL